MTLVTLIPEVVMRNKLLARICGFVLCACVLFGISACCTDCVPRDEFERRMASVKESGEEIEQWVDSAQAWILATDETITDIVTGINANNLGFQIDTSDPTGTPDDPCQDPDGCNWGAP